MTSLDQFLQETERTAFDRVRGDETRKVRNSDHFEEMRNYILKNYEGKTARNSFEDETGQVWDCIPIDQQQSLKNSGRPLATAPDLSNRISDKSNPKAISNKSPQAALAPEKKDRHGNIMFCPPGTIPIRRITLNELTRFETLDKYLRKGALRRGRAGNVLPKDPADVAEVHKWAHAYQLVNNLGGSSVLNIWPPAIGPNEIFSLCQHWYTAGSDDQLQTVEGGWQVFPQRYKTDRPCLFIFWTPDNYQSGYYNKEGPGFVQTNPNWMLGGYLNLDVSIPGGTQAELQLCWYLDQGNWWLYLNGYTQQDAVGYYPTTVYNGGPLSAGATEIDYGGEVLGTTSWPPMGSGAFPEQGYQQAAYMRNISYYPLAGGPTVPSQLSPVQLSANCFRIAVNENDNWGEYFYFGGPGGNNCA